MVICWLVDWPLRRHIVVASRAYQIPWSRATIQFGLQSRINETKKLRKWMVVRFTNLTESRPRAQRKQTRAESILPFLSRPQQNSLLPQFRNAKFNNNSLPSQQSKMAARAARFSIIVRQASARSSSRFISTSHVLREQASPNLGAAPVQKKPVGGIRGGYISILCGTQYVLNNIAVKDHRVPVWVFIGVVFCSLPATRRIQAGFGCFASERRRTSTQHGKGMFDISSNNSVTHCSSRSLPM